MRNIIKYFVGIFYKLLLDRYLAKTRHYGCDLEMIDRYADAFGFMMDKVYTKQNLLEKKFIFRIQP